MNSRITFDFRLERRFEGLELGRSRKRSTVGAPPCCAPTGFEEARAVLVENCSLFAIMLATLVFLAGCAKQAPPPEPPAVRSVSAVPVVKKTLFRVDQLPGEIQAYQDVAIFPKVPGFIESISVDRGSVVKKDQVMVTMYAPEYVARRDESRAKVDAATAKLREGESLLETTKAQLLEARAKWLGDDSTYTRLKAASMVPGVVASNDVIVLGQVVQAELESVKAWEKRVKASEHQVVSLRESLAATRKAAADTEDFAEYLKIKAPFDGYITKRNMHVGSFVGPLGSGAYREIVRILQLDLVRIVTPVPERDTHGVLAGAQVPFTVSTFPGEQFTGTVARLGNYLEQKTRTMPVELNYWNTDNRILPGMFCEVLWPTRRHTPTLFVPLSSVVTTTLMDFVCLIRRDEIAWVKVKRGQTMDSLIEVFGDIREGDLVALQGSDELRPGMEVKPVLVDHEEAEQKGKKERETYYRSPH